MTDNIDAKCLSNEELLEIINLQTEIVQFGLDFNAVISFITEKAQKLSNADGGVIELNEEEDLVYRATSGSATNFIGLRVNGNQSLSGLSFRLKEALICDDSYTDDRVDKEACMKIGLRSMAIVPLVHNNKSVGVLKVLSQTPNQFNHKTIALLQLLTGVIASTIYNASMFEFDQLYYRATHDYLTGLYNRSHFFDQIRQRFLLAKRTKESFGLISIDLDGLKFINDNYGHRAGDEAIKQVANRLLKLFRETDTVARIGGDEFAVIVNTFKTNEEGNLLIKRITEEVNMTYLFEDHLLKISVSAGFAKFNESNSNIDELIDEADKKMYEIKRSKLNLKL